MARSGAPGQHVNVIEVGRSAQVFEHRPRRLQLQPAAVVVSQSAAGQTDQHAHARRRVRRPRPAAYLESTAQRAQRGVRVAFGQFDRPAGRTRPLQPSTPVSKSASDLLQLVAGAARFLQVVRGQQDLDVGGQQLRALQPVRGRAYRTAGGGPTVGCPGQRSDAPRASSIASRHAPRSCMAHRAARMRSGPPPSNARRLRWPPPRSRTQPRGRPRRGAAPPPATTDSRARRTRGPRARAAAGRGRSNRLRGPSRPKEKMEAQPEWERMARRPPPASRCA